MKKLLLPILSVVFLSSCSLFMANTSITPGSETGGIITEEENEPMASSANENEGNITGEMKNPVVTIEMEKGGKIVVELYYDKAPNTVKNFVSLVQKGYYDGIVFHRIIPGFMIQGGDPQGTGTGGPGYNIFGEFADNNFTQNDIVHERGVISMARQGGTMDNPALGYNTAGSQFFIMHDAAPHLDNQYAAFGKVTEGMEIVDRIVSGKAGGDFGDTALEPEVMKKVTVDLFGQTLGEPEIIK